MGGGAVGAEEVTLFCPVEKRVRFSRKRAQPLTALVRSAELAETDVQSKAKIDAALAALRLGAAKVADLKLRCAGRAARKSRVYASQTGTVAFTGELAPRRVGTEKLWRSRLRSVICNYLPR